VDGGIEAVKFWHLMVRTILVGVVFAAILACIDDPSVREWMNYAHGCIQGAMAWSCVTRRPDPAFGVAR
jgi:hypothetical protein